MCRGCWIGYNSPSHVTPQIDEAATLIRELYAREPVGGPLHAVLDDWNIDGAIEPWEPEMWSSETRAIADRIAALFNAMPEVDRASALAHAGGLTV